MGPVPKHDHKASSRPVRDPHELSSGHRLQVGQRRFSIGSGIRKRTTTANMIECDTCTASFRTRFSCDQHMADKDHWASSYQHRCPDCGKRFRTWQAKEQHMDTVDHDARHECQMCDRWFRSQQAARQHMNALDHWEPPNYCRKCAKKFGSDNELRMHRNSRAHRGCHVPCPHCETEYTTASGVVHHLETGACPDADDIDRNEILADLRARDPYYIITRPRNQCGDDAGSDAVAQYNGRNRKWECSYCKRQFATRAGAKAHVRSPVHWGHVYRCPKGVYDCGRTFVSLAGCIAHLESESCGHLDFEDVQTKAIAVLRGSSTSNLK